MRSSRLFTGLAFLAPSLVAAQNSTNVTSVISQLLAGFQSLGLNTLVQVAGSIENTTKGQQLLSQLATGQHTVFAPNDRAFTGVPSNITSNPDLLTDVLAYHILFGEFNQTSQFPNTTIGRTALNGSSGVVFLEGTQNQVIAWAHEADNKTHILNQNTPVSILNSTVIGNFTILETDAVIDIPGEFADAIAANNLTTLKSALQLVGLFDTLNSIHGFTFFAPTDAAFQAALNQNSGALGGNALSNTTLIRTVLENHIINTTTVYTPNLISFGAGSQNLTSAAGEPFSFRSNSSGTFVTQINSTAKITTPDLILWNGVIHIVDAVFANAVNNSAAASSAFASATSLAAQAASSTASGPIGFTPSPSASGSSGSGASGSGNNTSPAVPNVMAGKAVIGSAVIGLAVSLLVL